MGFQKDSIISVLSSNTPLTRREITEIIYGKGADQSRIYASLENLVSQNIVFKQGERPSYYSLRKEFTIPIASKYEKKQDSKQYLISIISETELETAYEAVCSDPTYGNELNLVKRIFRDKTFQKNDDEDIVALKIGLVDVTNSTHLSQYKSQISIPELANIIVGIHNFDQRVATRDDSLVEQLARSNGKINLFSFASKYCHYHNSLIYNRDDYAKYDTIVHDCLPLYLQKAGITLQSRKITPNTLNKLRQNYDYSTFNSLVDQILINISIPNKKMMFDYMMWYYNRV